MGVVAVLVSVSALSKVAGVSVTTFGAAIRTVEWLPSALCNCVAVCGWRGGDGVLSSRGGGACCEGASTK